MPKSFVLNVNGAGRNVRCEDDTPLLYVLRNDLSLNGPKFGCGLGQCGACTVLVGSEATRSCVTPIGAVGSEPILTLDGLAASGQPHALQRAFLAVEAAQCGYCTNGMIMTAMSQSILETSLSQRAMFHAPLSKAPVLRA